MNLEDFVSKSISKRPLIREKIKEQRRKIVFSSIDNIEDLIYEKNKLATKIMRNTIEGIDCTSDKEKFSDIEKNITKLLLENGFSKDYLSNFYFCKKCKDTGYLNGKICDCIMKDLIEERVLESGISNKKRQQNYLNFDFSLFDGKFDYLGVLYDSKKYMRDLVNFTKKYCDNLNTEDYGLLFYGKSGAGKTYLSSAMVNYVLDKGNRACFITSTEFFELMSDYTYSFYRDKKELQEKIDFVRNVDFLVLDDLGNEISTKNNNSFLSSILDYRFERSLNTVITTNLGEYDFGEEYDSRVASRIRGNFKIFMFPPFNLRDRISKNMNL